MKKQILICAAVGLLAPVFANATQQPFVVENKWNEFSLSDVKLTDSYFSQAMQRHKEYVLSLEVDRLIPHILRNCGLTPKGENYGGWEKNGGCTYGHYMSSCALFYAATGEKVFLDRLDYMISELERCRANTEDGWILGTWLKRGFKDLKEGRMNLFGPDEAGQPWNFNNNGNAWYGIHKVLAGLRDAYVYADRKEAFDLWVSLSDYVADVVLESNSDLVQAMLAVEQGGMNEVMIDLYAATGNEKYKKAAERFDHITVVYPVANGEDVLTYRHANDQIPKFVGTSKEYNYTGKELHLKAAEKFWEMVVDDHSLAIGGNSCYERFGAPGEESKRLDFSSAETCNTYNMLKLSRQLFMQTGDTKYLDYYEWAVYNHILASQDPCHNGSVTYYTTLLPGGFKQYSSPYDSFWCCVGTGLENHAKYGENIYFHTDNDLLVNLFIPSVLEWDEKGLGLRMDTKYPESDTIRVKVEKNDSFGGRLLLRYPRWAKAVLLKKNGVALPVNSKPGEYLVVDNVKAGDEIVAVMPMSFSIRYVKDEPDFGSVFYGPLVLAGDLGTDKMPCDRVSDNRALRNAVPSANIPMMVGDTADISSWIVEDRQNPLHFTANSKDGKVEMVPYFMMHHRRNSVYWKIYSEDGFAKRSKALTDRVKIGDVDDEKAHKYKGENDTLEWHDFFWACNKRYRAARNGGWFSYDLKIDPKSTSDYSLICTFWGDESDKNQFEIWIDGQKIADVDLHRRNHLTYVDDIYPIPANLTKGKKKVTVRFHAPENKIAGGLYDLKITSDTNYR